MAPPKSATKFVHQCGVVVRDNVPISLSEWNQIKNLEGNYYVTERNKNICWKKLMAHFTLPVFDSPERTEAMKDKVKHWALKKMAEQFNKWKNRLYRDWVNKKKVPDFTGTLERQRAHWPAFLQYKNTAEAKERSAKNKLNAAKKIYNHKLGGGGYVAAEPKWDRIEAALRAKGIILVTDTWPRRVRNWILAHGGEYDESGNVIVDETKETPIPRQTILDAITDAREGRFFPDREYDELSKALGTKEKGGSVRGRGGVTWYEGFPEDRDSYRSRERAKRRKEQEHHDRLSIVENIIHQQQRELHELRLAQSSRGATHQLLLQDSQPGGTSQRKSSVASATVGADEASNQTYPVDSITEKKTCELHEAVRNITMKAADGYALPCESTALYCGNEIPDGYARVGVDQVYPGYASLELHYPGGDDERTLGDVQGGLILWPKKLIMFPGWTPPPRPPSPSRSPSPRQLTPSPRQPTPSPRQPTHEPPPELSPPPPEPTPESEASVWLRTESRRQFAEMAEKRKPKPKEKYSEAQTQFAVSFLTQPSQISINRPDDYVRTMRKIPPGGKRRRDVAQLGRQSNQSISPLKVATDMGSALEKDHAIRTQFAAEIGISLSQLEADDMPSLMRPTRWTWEYGKDLVSPDELQNLPTQMTRLHKWYKNVTSEGRILIPVKITDEHFNGADEITIPIEEIYQLYQLDALDLSILTTYCL